MKDLKGTEEVLEIVKIRLGATEENADITPFIKILIQQAGQKILNLTNLDTVPKGLYYLWANIVKDLFIIELPNHDLSQGLVSTGGGSITIGDTSIKGENSNSNSGNAGSKSKEKSLEDVVLNYKQEIYRYRDLRW